MEKAIKHILFVCTGNICRSVTAEIVMRRRLEELGWTHIELASAGVSANLGRPCPDETLSALKRCGLDGKRHRSQPLTPALVDWADLVLAMTESHQMWIAMRYPRAVGKLKLFKSYAGLSGDVDDPYGGDDGVHDAMTAEVAAAVETILDLLKKEEKKS
jgi:protein-tyrosine-phosphatase